MVTGSLHYMLKGEKTTSEDEQFSHQILSKNSVKNEYSECDSINAFELLPYSQKTSPVISKDELRGKPKAQSGIAMVTQVCKRCGYVRSFSVNHIMASI